MRYFPELSLPQTAYIPGQGSPHERKVFHGWCLPENSGFIAESHWQNNSHYLFGLDCFNAGFYWEAHEVWSEPFKNTSGLDDVQHLFFKALIQLAAAMLHLRNKKSKPARTTGEKAIEKLSSVADKRGNHYLGLDIIKTIHHVTRMIHAPIEPFPPIVLHMAS